MEKFKVLVLGLLLAACPSFGMSWPELYEARAGKILSSDDRQEIRKFLSTWGEVSSYPRYIFKNAALRGLPNELRETLLDVHATTDYGHPRIETTPHGIRVILFKGMDDPLLIGALVVRERERLIVHHLLEKSGTRSPDPAMVERLLLATEWEWWNLFSPSARHQVKMNLNILARDFPPPAAAVIKGFADYMDHTESNLELYIAYQLHSRQAFQACANVFME